MIKTWKFVITVLVVGIFMFIVAACTSIETESESNTNTSMFVQLEKTGYWRVVYHKETKVMYAVSIGSDHCGVFTPLVNADGTLMVWEDTK